MNNIERRQFLKLLAMGSTVTLGGIKLSSVYGKDVKGESSSITEENPVNTVEKPYINTSIFEIFKIGLGPSSSHTIAPMKAAFDFLNEINKLHVLPDKSYKIRVKLLGSLSATGKNHGTDRAITAGLLGYTPENCPENFFDNIFKEKYKPYRVKLNNKFINFAYNDILYDSIDHNYPYSNTMIFELFEENKKLFEKEYYSVGGGFIEWKGYKGKTTGEPYFKYTNMKELTNIIKNNNLTLHQLVIENEKSITQRNETYINEHVKKILNVMENSVKQGLNAVGTLPGFIGLTRNASILYNNSRNSNKNFDNFLVELNAAAFAAAEENAVGHRVVTAPTLGSAGVLPAIIYIAKNYLKISDDDLTKGFMAAAATCFIIKHNASLAGADVGCQGEIGVASAMAASLLAYIKEESYNKAANAATIALEHHLGLTCNPVGGYVQIPCIERNAIGAAKAYSSYLIAINEDPNKHIPDFDTIVKVMNLTGRDMDPKYKETSLDYLGKWRPVRTDVTMLNQKTCTIC